MAEYDSNPPVFFDSGIAYDSEPAPLPSKKKPMAKIRRDWTKMNRPERLGKR